MRPTQFLPIALLGLLCTQCRKPSETHAETRDAPEILAAPPTPALPTTPSLPERVTFNEHIQPILSENCYQCHGPDEETRYPEDEPLRLDLAEHAFTPRENGKPVIIKGDSAASVLVKLLHSDDLDAVMPPPDSHKEIDAEEIALLEKWIDQGAEYQDHWAFLPLSRPPVPQAGQDWAGNDIDPFIAAKLADKGLRPNPEQDPARFYRRLHFDLTGLPPSRSDLTAFSWENLDHEIDRLLATSASAEHFARLWLDAARYGDTHGIHVDNYRAIWPYRDWVIAAFQQNMPWDQFTIEQIAGDMLPEPSLDQIVATGFHRCLPTTGEGGAIADEYLAIYAQDRTTTTSAVWLGLTMGCAACHDHKFDPISMADNYSFNAFFRNTPMSALDKNKADHPPNIFVPLAADRPTLIRLESEQKESEQALTGRKNHARDDFKKWLTTVTPQLPQQADPSLALHLPLTEPAGPITGLVDQQARQWPSELPRIDGPVGKAQLISKTPIKLGDLASFSRKDQVTYGGFIRTEGKPNGAIIARMDPSHAHRGWDLYLQQGKLASHVIDSWPDKANKIVANAGLKPGTWQHVMITFDGSKPGNKASAIYIDGKLVKSSYTHSNVGNDIVASVPLQLGSRDNNDSKLNNGSVALQDFRFYRRLLSPKEIQDIAKNNLIQEFLSTPPDQRSKQQLDSLYQYYLTSIDEPSRELREKIAANKSQQNALRKRGSNSLVMREKPGSEPFAHILKRGAYADKGERVTAATPEALPPMPEDAPRNRLGLARWLISSDNPLTPRVTMNRLWYQFFGTGIVETVEDFGVMGARPSHPQLLDWLAAEFVESGWDHRHMVKRIVSSAAYRQSGAISPEKLEIDPNNRLISRGPRYRLDAEEIRDLALAASDTLAPAIGGPPVKPYQPEGVWAAVAMKQSNTGNYKADSGDKLYRRSIYTFWKRTAPHPAMEILNAPSRETFCVRRERTNTPLQAFVTLNDPQFVEASRQLAQLSIKQSSDPTQRLDFITERLISRRLNTEERSLVIRTLDTALATFEGDPEAAKSFISTGASQPDSSLDPAELAAWTLVSSEILNLDETLTK